MPAHRLLDMMQLVMQSAGGCDAVGGQYDGDVGYIDDGGNGNGNAYMIVQRARVMPKLMQVMAMMKM